jgi:hypothetical protein
VPSKTTAELEGSFATAPTATQKDGDTHDRAVALKPSPVLGACGAVQFDPSYVWNVSFPMAKQKVVDVQDKLVS